MNRFREATVAEIENTDDYITTVDEYAEFDENDNISKWIYEIRRWRYQKYSVLCRWSSPTQLEFEDDMKD